MAAEPVSPEVATSTVMRCVALAQDVVEEPADELQREILEGQRRPVEELEQPLAGIELDERADSRVAEARVGLGAQPLEQRGLELVARECPDDAPRRRCAYGSPRRRVQAARASARARTGPPSLARPASSVSQKPSAGARPRVEM